MTTTQEGKLIVTGSSQNALGIARYALAQFLPNDQLSGFTNNAIRRFAAARFLSTGTLDTIFGGGVTYK